MSKDMTIKLFEEKPNLQSLVCMPKAAKERRRRVGLEKALPLQSVHKASRE